MVSTTIVLEVGCKYEPCHYFMLEESVALRDMRTWFKMWIDIMPCKMPYVWRKLWAIGVYLKNRYMIVSSRSKVYLWWLILCIREYDHEIVCLWLLVRYDRNKGLNGIVSRRCKRHLGLCRRIQDIWISTKLSICLLSWWLNSITAIEVARVCEDWFSSRLMRMTFHVRVTRI